MIHRYHSDHSVSLGSISVTIINRYHSDHSVSLSSIGITIINRYPWVLYLKHQRLSGVPSEFFPTVTISPTRNDLRRQTGKVRSMSRMVVAHWG